MITGYVHDWNPILVEIAGPLAVRWYGLAYLVSFILGFFLLRYLARRDRWVLPAGEVSDFIAICAMLGVFIGGRLGYVLFYMIPDQGIKKVMEDPMSIIRVWDGGMASHGGILGLIIVTFFYARKKSVSWTGLGDGLCVVAPVGLFSVRMANFINGELYGRIDEACKWAVKFPSTLFDRNAPEHGNLREAALAVVEKEPSQPDLSKISPDHMTAALRKHEGLHETFEGLLYPRHPSQLYEGFLEGLLLFIVLWVLRMKFPRLGHGILTGIFFIGYAAGRIFCEQYREPDSAMIGMFTKGQFYSLFMIGIGVAFLIWGMTGGKRVEKGDVIKGEG